MKWLNVIGVRFRGGRWGGGWKDIEPAGILDFARLVCSGCAS